MYVIVIVLRVYAYISENMQITYDPSSAFIPREKWDTFDPQIVADTLFAAANILRYSAIIYELQIYKYFFFCLLIF
jgi:hypothetical protein